MGCAPLAPAVRPLSQLLPAVGGCPPPPGLACLVLLAQAAVPGGSPRLPGSDRTPLARAVCSPPRPPARAQFARVSGAGAVCPYPPPARARFVRAAGAGDPVLVLGPACRGVPVGCAGGIPHVLLLHVSGARCWLRGSPSPSPPLGPLALSVGCHLGGLLVSVLPWGSCTTCVRQGAPSGSGGPPCGGFSRLSSPVSPLFPCCSPWYCAAGWGCPLSSPPPLGRSS